MSGTRVSWINPLPSDGTTGLQQLAYEIELLDAAGRLLSATGPVFSNEQQTRLPGTLNFSATLVAGPKTLWPDLVALNNSWLPTAIFPLSFLFPFFLSLSTAGTAGTCACG